MSRNLGFWCVSFGSFLSHDKKVPRRRHWTRFLPGREFYKKCPLHPLSVTLERDSSPVGGALERRTFDSRCGFRFHLSDAAEPRQLPSRGALGQRDLEMLRNDDGSPLPTQSRRRRDSSPRGRAKKISIESAVQVRASPLRHAARATSPVGGGLERRDQEVRRKWRKWSDR